ncbi:hypothetical protein [Streptomyces sp. G-G2]|uniref:hypothetical protein n=1 Tax=Streptomyces sp. G-G2 TaxID=3046201 RepID=UPI0024B951F0|nr:hypothetical protein [Streptomyces sp. G-G2]MDJ0382329.1 hypothetical protein [Streptomyces sp. G-G2]
MTPFRFPDDLISLKRRQVRAYHQLALRPAVGAAELRRELIRLSCLISSHPYWAERGWSSAGRIELFRAAESGPDGVRGLVVRWNGEEFIVAEQEARPA